MDRITAAHLKNFLEAESIAEPDEATAFEHFVNFCVLSDRHSDAFDIMDLHTGGGADLGLDGIAVLVNGVAVASRDEVEDLLRTNRYLDVQFVFTQAKTSSSFDGAGMGTFGEGVLEFFNENPILPCNERVAARRDIMSFVYENAASFSRTKPSCSAFYSTTGTWKDDAYLAAKLGKSVERLQETGLFNNVEFVPLGADELHDLYTRSQNRVETEILFTTKALIPEMAGISEAYIGVLPATEFRKLISDESGGIRKSIFEDNVRDFQGDNKVNQEISATLEDSLLRTRFSVLNNGITIVARDVKTTGNRFLLSDYQIVNGCQTSHVVYSQIKEIGDDVQIPIKIIATEDEDIISSIVAATNQQTAISTDDLFASGKLQRKLEAFFNSHEGNKALHYERRSKQYNAAQSIEKVRIITRSQLVRSFAAFFLDEPHRASRYYSALQAQVGTTIFGSDHHLEPYYTCALAYYRLEFLFRNRGFDVGYKPARFHLLMASRYLAGPDTPSPAATANKVKAFCSGINEVLWSDVKAERLFKECAEVISEALNGDPLEKDTVRTQTFTDSVKAAIHSRTAV